MIKINAKACTGCSYCVVTCPVEAIRIEFGERAVPEIDTEICTECGECVYVCPNRVYANPDEVMEPVPLEDHYDVVVVGAGIGGLMTAAGLVKAGKQVLVLEQMSFVGGKYTHLNYHDYAISTAAWTCPGPNSRIGKLCTKLGAEIEWVTIHDTKDLDQKAGNHWFVIRDGRKFNTLDEAQASIVGGNKGMAKVYRWMADMYDPRVEYPNGMTAREYIRKFVPGNAEYEHYVQTIITYCFASQTVDTFSAMETKRAIVDSIEQMADWGTARGGTQAIVAGLEAVVRKHGGTIALRTPVNRINVEHGRAVGVTLEDGRVIGADTVVHNAGLNRLMRLVGEEHLPSGYTARLKDAVPANVAALVLGTKEPLLGDEHSLLHTMGWERTLNCYAPTYFDPKMAPAGHSALDVFWVLEPPYDLNHELNLVLNQLREVFPKFDQQVEVMIPMFFNGVWTAEMAHRMGQSGADRLDPQTPIDQLYFVGYDAIGYGMAGDIIPHGVERALYLMLGDEQYAPEDEKSSVRFQRLMKSFLLKGVAALTRLKK
ncbi:MAG: FAD-dependent oxidoreductase [Anaerolineaceae bacterium]|nr:FAD-dependent oxidoreductase [Anaerolineaceae bacterium]